jgi:DnaJ family protein C protein 17
MVRPQEEMNYFAIMGLTPSATEAEIRKAYRKQSLALHPDKNRDMNPELASARFHEMQLAYEVLMDPSARLAAAERNKAEEARKERRGAYEGKRKEMADELERREEEDRLKRYKGAQDAQHRQATLDKLKEEGRKLREEKENKIMQEEERMRIKLQQQQEHTRASERQASPLVAAPSDMPELGPLDLTVRLRFPTTQLPDLMDLASGSSLLDSPLARGLEARFGKLDSLICKALKKDKVKRETTAHATFNALDSAYAAVKAGSKLRAGGDGPASVLEDVWIGWAAGSKAGGVADEQGHMNGEPARISWLRTQGRLSTASTDEVDRSDTGSEEAVHTPEHDILQRMKARNEDSSRNNSTHTSSISSPFPSFTFTASTPSHGTNLSKTSDGPEQTSFDDFETSTPQKMRQAERRRMEEAIRQLDEQPTYS